MSSGKKDLKPQIIQHLQRLAEDYKKYPKEPTDIYRAKAYQIAIKVLRESDVKIKKASDVDKIEEKGFGKKTKDKIKEFIETGQIKKLKEVKKRENKYINLFMKIHGVGIKKAKEWYEAGYKTLKDIKDNVKLTSAQKIGLKYIKDFQEKIPRDEIKKLNDKLRIIFDLMNIEKKAKYRYKICGSFRRGAKESGDIDVIITEKKGKLDEDYVIHQLEKHKIIIDELGKGKKKFLGVVRVGKHGKARRMDIEWVPYHEWPYALLYFTGSKDFNTNLRGIAKKKGYVLNEKGLFVEKIPFMPNKIKSERDIMKVLGVKYKTPEERV